MPQNNQMSMCFNQLDNGNEYNMHMQYEKFSIQELCKLDQSSKKSYLKLQRVLVIITDNV